MQSHTWYQCDLAVPFVAKEHEEKPSSLGYGVQRTWQENWAKNGENPKVYHLCTNLPENVFFLLWFFFFSILNQLCIRSSLLGHVMLWSNAFDKTIHSTGAFSSPLHTQHFFVPTVSRVPLGKVAPFWGHWDSRRQVLPTKKIIMWI